MRDKPLGTKFPSNQDRAVVFTGMLPVIFGFSFTHGVVGLVAGIAIGTAYILTGPVLAFALGNVLMLGLWSALAPQVALSLQLALGLMFVAWEIPQSDTHYFATALVGGWVGLLGIAVVSRTFLIANWVVGLMIASVGMVSLYAIHRLEMVSMGLIE